MKMCAICNKRPVIFNRTLANGDSINLCDICFDIKFLCDGLQIDYNINTIEESIIVSDSSKVKFVRNLHQEVN
jgi:hypothetical protein